MESYGRATAVAEMDGDTEGSLILLSVASCTKNNYPICILHGHLLSQLFQPCDHATPAPGMQQPTPQCVERYVAHTCVFALFLTNSGIPNLRPPPRH